MARPIKSKSGKAVKAGELKPDQQRFTFITKKAIVDDIKELKKTYHPLSTKEIMEWILLLSFNNPDVKKVLKRVSKIKKQ